MNVNKTNYDLKEMNERDYGLTEMNGNITRMEVRLSDDTMMRCKQKWWVWSNIYGVIGKSSVMKSIAE